MPTAPVAAKPSKHIFDPFNSSATGHQRAENRLSGSTSWRDSRGKKLREQFSAGAGGGKRVSDTVGAGSLDFGQDGRTENGGWEKGAKGLRTGGQQSIWESWKVEKSDERPAKRMKTEENAETKSTSVVNPFTPFRKQDGTIRESSWTSHECSPSDLLEPISPYISQDDIATTAASKSDDSTAQADQSPPPQAQAPQIFTSLTFYLNGSTAPYSDHKIKHLIATHGGNMSISLGRRTVTHVIVSKPNSSGGCGGGLAGSKIQKEIAALKGKVKFVTAEWVMESVKAGKRVTESRFGGMSTAPKGVGRIDGMFKTKEKEK